MWKLRAFETVNLSIQLRYFMVTWITYLNILVANEKLIGSSYPIQRPYLFHIPQRNHGVNLVMIPQLHQRMLHRKDIPHQIRWEILTRVNYVISCQIQRYHALIRNTSPLDIGHINSSISLSSMASRPKSSRTAPYLFIVLGRMILNLVSWTHFSKFST